jgi:hypothetical protein
MRRMVKRYAKNQRRYLLKKEVVYDIAKVRTCLCTVDGGKSSSCEATNQGSKPGSHPKKRYLSVYSPKVSVKTACDNNVPIQVSASFQGLFSTLNAMPSGFSPLASSSLKNNAKEILFI